MKELALRNPEAVKLPEGGTYIWEKIMAIKNSMLITIKLMFIVLEPFLMDLNTTQKRFTVKENLKTELPLAGTKSGYTKCYREKNERD